MPEPSQRRVRVAEVVRPATGGIRRHVSVLMAHLDRARFQPILAAPEDFTLDIAQVEVPRIPIAIRARTVPLADYRTIQELAARLRDQVDLVHAHGLRGALVGGFAAGRVGVPFLFTAHNLVPKPGLASRYVLQRLGQRTARVLAVSQAVAATLVAAGIPAGKIVVAPNGLETAPFDQPADTGAIRTAYNLEPDAPLVVAVGRLAPEKGFDVLLAAFARLRQSAPQAALILVGAGPEKPALQAMARPIGDPVRFAGYIPDVIPLLQAADVIAVPSRQEGQGLVALEAMAARKPVVASRVGGLAETVVPGETGLLIPPEDPDALADALAGLLRDPARRASMGQAGRTRVEQEYTLTQMIGRIEAVYTAILTQ